MGSKASNASIIVELYQKWRGKAKPVQGLTFMVAGTDGKIYPLIRANEKPEKNQNQDCAANESR
jgi:hypothetical protein